MPQAFDLGQIQNQPRTLYRGRVNVGFQSLASFNEGVSAPTVTYPNMIWADIGSHQIKQRNSSNTAWTVIGTVGDTWKFTNVDTPPNEFTTGDLKPTYKIFPDPGWVMVRDGTIGDQFSQATERAHADCEALFRLIWNNIGNNAYIVSYGNPISKGSSAAADWAAHRSILLGPAMGRVIGIAGVGPGLSARWHGSWVGEETHLQTIDEMPMHGHATQEYAGVGGGAGNRISAQTTTPAGPMAGVMGGGRAFNIMQPTWFIMLMCKL